MKLLRAKGQVQSCQIAAPVVTAQGTYRCASYAEVVTVLTGSYGNNFGEKFEPKGEMMKPGSLFVLQP
jgi:hypothetical protein